MTSEPFRGNCLWKGGRGLSGAKCACEIAFVSAVSLFNLDGSSCRDAPLSWWPEFHLKRFPFIENKKDIYILPVSSINFQLSISLSNDFLIILNIHMYIYMFFFSLFLSKILCCYWLWSMFKMILLVSWFSLDLRNVEVFVNVFCILDDHFKVSVQMGE